MMTRSHEFTALPLPGQRSITLAGEFWHGATAHGLAAGLRQLDWLVAEVDLDEHLLGARELGGRLINRAVTPIFSREYSARILTTAQQTASDTFIATKGSFVRKSVLDELRRRGIFCVNYYPDVAFTHPGLSEARLSAYDLIATTKAYHLSHLRERFGEQRVAFVHHGYSPLVHRRRSPALGENDYDYDICYVGSASPSKIEWLSDLPRAFPGRRIALAGAYWEHFVGGTPLAECFVGHRVTGDFYARLLERSRVNIALHFGTASQQGWSDDISTRTFEIPACGGFMLHIDNDEIRTLFDVPHEIDVFGSRSELYAKIDHYLDRPELRRSMIEHAYARCVPAYSLATRAAEMASLIPART